MSKTPSTGIRTHARVFATASPLTLVEQLALLGDARSSARFATTSLLAFVELSTAGFDGRALSPHVMTFASRFNRQPSRSPGRGPAILRATPQLLWAAV